MQREPRVSIIIVTFNSSRSIGRLIDGLFEINYPNREFIIVDNGSEDLTLDIVGAKFRGHNSQPKLLRLARNLGLSKGWNLGSTLATGEYLLFLDDDIVPTKDFLTNLVEYCESHDGNLGAVCSTQVSLDRRTVNDIGLLNLGRSVEDLKMRLELGDVEVAFPQSPILVRRKAWNEVEGFQIVNFYGDFIDADLGWRLWTLGYRVTNVADSVIFHKHDTLHTSFRYFHYKRCEYIMHIKNWQLRSIIYVVPFLLVGLVFSIRRERFWPETIRALMWVLKNLGGILQDRRKVQQARKLSDKQLAAVLWFFNPVPVLRQSQLRMLRRIRVPKTMPSG